jgi:CubicO group peptidase (beta-lactamase class C family)
MGTKKVTFSPQRLHDPKSFASGGAGLAGTVMDYVRFAEAVRTHRILKPETHVALAKDQVGKEVDAGMAFGFGVGIVTDANAQKTKRTKGSYGWAGIYGTEFWIDPVAKLSVVVLTNVVGQQLDQALETAIYD